ncbi:fibronectin type III domain-containing protein [Allorhizocola rhizosphaerae]|uniref:fibronectin type III domain-containing protein n=1 Tax=Allorhizocola rhizosphaerae TaxID=1872709 RepID=UPI001FEC989B|nr:carbohydrate binding domain-containing protein [Allorhizocola rhizosphaerae]
MKRILLILALVASTTLLGAPHASAAELAVNGGFETGSLSPWSCSLGSVVTSPVHSGARALRGAASSSDNARCTQTVNGLVPGTSYTLSGWFNGNYTYLGVTGGASTWRSGSWGQLSLTFTASGGSVQIYFHGWYGQGAYHADDISLQGQGGGNPGGPGAPGNLRSTGVTNTSISLAWNASTGTVSGYRVYEGGIQRLQTTSLSGTISGLGTCTTHTYTVRAYNAAGESAGSNAVTVTTTGCTNPGPTAMKAPYLYLGWGNPPSVSTVMSATGIRQFTMAFMLSGGGCTPMWDSQRPLTGGVDQQVINQIRAGGGDIEISFGGWSGNKLGPNCSTPQALANAYQQVINAYNLKFIDIDIENTDEFENEAVQDRILNALKIVKQNNPGITTIITFGTSQSGPTFWGTRLINRSRELQANIDNFTIMPFDFGCTGNMFTCTTSAADGLRNALKAAYGWTDDQAYRRMGISGMNGLSDQQEMTSLQHWTDIKNWATARHIPRLAFWSVNRDRPCPGGGVTSNCSGISQPDWEFTRITASHAP